MQIIPGSLICPSPSFCHFSCAYSRKGERWWSMGTNDPTLSGVDTFIFNNITVSLSSLQALYFYQPDQRGSCLIFEGNKNRLQWFRNYLLVVTKDSKAIPRGIGGYGNKS